MSHLSIFVLLCCTVVCDSSHTQVSSGDSSDSCKKFQLNKEHFNKRFSGPGLYEMSAPGHHDCVRNCFYLSQCKSTDYNRKYKICKINDVDSTQITASDFEQKNGAIFSDITAWPSAMAGACGLRPCSLRQRCIPDKDTYHCADIYCGNPESIPNGIIVLNGGTSIHSTGGTSIHSTASVTCDAGYQGSVDTIWCTASGKWDTVSCVPISCGTPVAIANGKVVLNTGTSYMNTASVVCYTSFKASTNTITCTASGSWETAICRDCYIDTPRSYSGTKSITRTGYACERWDDYTGYKTLLPQNIPEPSLAEAENYCRDPSSGPGDGGLWCFSSNPYATYEYCDIPRC